MNTYPEQDCFRRDVPKDAAEILANDILKEQATRINEDTLIRVSIADEATARSQRDSQLELWFNTEEADRISADNALGVQIADEATDRSDADTLLAAAISAEEEARIAADTSLGDAIVDEEDARIAADSTLNTLITNEASTRASADAALDTRLDVLEPLVMTEAEHTKLAGIAAGAEVNVNADWDSVSGASQILNKPDIPDSMFDFSDHSRFIFGDNAYGSTLVTNLNTIEKTGTYTALAGATGAPDATHAFGVQHSNSTQNANIAFQQAVAVDANMPTYARIKLAGAWSAWIRTWNAKDVPGFSATPSAGKAMVWPENASGTFTPTIAFGGNSVGVTYSARAGRYVISGGVLHFWITIVLSSKGTSEGLLAVYGLPQKSALSTYTICSLLPNNITFGGFLVAYMRPGVSGTIVFETENPDGTFSNITYANCANNSGFYITGMCEM